MAFQLGAIIEGTTRIQDTLPELLFALGDMNQERAAKYNMELIELGFGYSQCGVTFDDDDSPLWDEQIETLEDIQQEIMEALDEHAPDYVYFGVNEGDGACLGFWPDIDRINEDRRFGDLPDYQEIGEDYRGLVVDVTDHGDVALFSVADDGTHELWSCV